MARWIDLLDDISLDLISEEDKFRIEALVRLKVPEKDQLSLFRGDSRANAARLKALILQDAGATTAVCLCHIIFYPPVDLLLWRPDPLCDALVQRLSHALNHVTA